MMRAFGILLAATMVLSIALPTDAQEDNSSFAARLVLKSGGTLDGKHLKKKQIDGKPHILFQTGSGGMLQLQARLVRKVIKLEDPASRAYAKLKANANSPQTHWEAIQWCELQSSGRTRFKHEINFHLRQIVKADPNDDDAWRRLKYTRRDGVWVDDKRMFAASGYVREGGWASLEAVRIGEQLAKMEEQKDASKTKVTKWIRQLKSNPANAQISLMQILDESTVIPLFQFATSKKRIQPPRMRQMIMEAIAQIDSRATLNALVYFSIEDPDLNIRDRATTLLENGKNVDPKLVVQTVVSSNYLQAENSQTIQRAAFLLGRMDHESAILPLIDALVTTHTVLTGNQPGRTSASSVGGNIQDFGVSGGPTKRKEMRRNDKALSALASITGCRLQYDELAWRRWYIDQYSLAEVDVRADDE